MGYAAEYIPTWKQQQLKNKQQGTTRPPRKPRGTGDKKFLRDQWFSATRALPGLEALWAEGAGSGTVSKHQLAAELGINIRLIGDNKLQQLIKVGALPRPKQKDLFDLRAVVTMLRVWVKANQQ